ncbi:hypothetical protein S7711_08897 [Stachybotrys chartarum IBT 7711]|uniref:FAD-binding PCMH-type domain-containing protein n=1 Tax=Stachybotrys chartarum (strain CBS 109288 / IBT 7711) TaxID=1280523 RepID=A0A084ALA1_STACB|nr:hypothetical protein S7711_08897 [Stachybotrys chartarum IBT 7711]KFA54518.1 hypothetical protein S40293_08941 [Stachybotrys chartarum IBT 40293]
MILTSTLCLGLLAFQASGAFVGGVAPRQQPGMEEPATGAPQNNTNRDLRSILSNPCVPWHSDTEVSFPEDGDAFVNATLRWSSYATPSYVAAIAPANEDDVAQAVLLARQNNLNFLATGGRHGYTSTYGRLRNGLAIDLSKLNSVSVDRDDATLTIGGGTIARQILGPVAEAGFELPIGGCSCPGMVGVTIAGGITNWLGTRGLLLDSLLHVRMVTSTGEIVEASETVNPELFWGIRGAAHNFGIIVSATFRLYPMADEMLMIETSWTASMVEDYYQALAVVLEAEDPLLSANSIINWNPNTNETIVFGHFTYFGSHEAGLELLDPILRMNPPLRNDYSVAWTNYHRMTLFNMDEANCVPGLIHAPYGVLTKTVDIPTLMRAFHRMDNLFHEHPGARSSAVVFHSYRPDAALAVPDDSTAFAWRDALNYMYVLLTWSPSNPEAGYAAIRAASEVRNSFVQTSGYDGHAAYMNFAQGDETIEQVYSVRKLPQLAELKATWDPDNVFRYHYPLPTSYP